MTMKTIGLTMAMLGALAISGAAQAQTKTVTINAISATGVGAEIGTLTLRDSPQGMIIEPKLSALPPGPHGFHVHTNPNCGPGPGPNNQPAPGLAAGGHYDPKTTNAHRGPHTDAGHLGDLPILVVDTDGMTRLPMIARRLKVSDVNGRSFMIHAGADNFDDQPAALGGGGGRIACGVVR